MALRHAGPRVLRWPLAAAWALAALPGAAAPGEPVRIDGVHLVEVASRVAHGHLAAVSTRHEIEPLRLPDDLRVPAGKLVLRAQAEPADARRMASALAVSVLVEVDARVLRRVPVWFKVQAWGPGWQAVRALPVGHVVAEGDLQQAEQRLLTLAPPAGPVLPVGQRLKRAVAAGQVVDAAGLEPLPLVGRGDRVLVELQRDGVSIQAPGVALADAREGQRLPVRLRADAVLMVIATAAGRARLAEREAQ